MAPNVSNGTEENEEREEREESEEEKAKKIAAIKVPHQVGFRIDRKRPKPEAVLSEEGDSLTVRTAGAADFSESFMAKLKAAFIEQEWHIQREKNTIRISALAVPAKQISITKIDKNMVFSGSVNSEKEIVLAANAYQAACLEEGERIIFEVNSHNENSAISFMTKLKNEGFDIKKITAVKLKEGNLAGKSMSEYTQELIAK